MFRLKVSTREYMDLFSYIKMKLKKFLNFFLSAVFKALSNLPCKKSLHSILFITSLWYSYFDFCRLYLIPVPVVKYTQYGVLSWRYVLGDYERDVTIARR